MNSILLQGTGFSKRRLLKNIGEYLKNERVAHGFSLPKLAAKLRCSTQFIYRIENGLSVPSIETLKRMVALYGLSENEILELILSEERIELKKHLSIF